MAMGLVTIRRHFYISYSSFKKGATFSTYGWQVIAANEMHLWAQHDIGQINSELLDHANAGKPEGEPDRDTILILCVIPLDLCITPTI